MKIIGIIGVLAHRFARGVAQFGHRGTADILEFDDDVQGGNTGIVAKMRADAKGDLGFILEITV